MGKKKPVVTNATRWLASEKIPFETVEYEAEEVGENFGVKIAELTNLPPEKCFKTLVAKGKEYIVLCIPVNKEADLKKVAAVSGNKKVEMLPTKDLLGVTGYIRGGVSPIGMKKKFATYIDKSCLDFDKMTVSGGVCGLSVLMKPEDLIKTVDATVEDLVKE